MIKQKFKTKLFQEAARMEVIDKQQDPGYIGPPIDFYLGAAVGKFLEKAGCSSEDINTFVRYIRKEWDEQAVSDFADGMEM